jgi:hypothetical protein
MKKTALLFIATAFAAATVAHADESTFKAYGFADAEIVHQSFNANNFLVDYGNATPGTQAYLDHVNTYLDWKPNANVRVLAEIAFNPFPTPSNGTGTKLVFDSTTVYNYVYTQTREGVIQGLNAQIPGFSSFPTAIQDHFIDSLVAVQNPTATTQGVLAKLRSGNSDASRGSKNHGITLPRVHTDLLLSDEIKIRVGKFITPSGIWNVDHGSPTILTIKQPYETSFLPIFPESQTGVQLFGHKPFGDQDISYAGWLSTGRGSYDDDFGQIPKNLDDWAAGAHLQTDMSYLDGIRLGGTFHTGTIRDSYEWDLLPATPLTDLANSDHVLVDSAYMRELIYGLDAKVSWMHFVLQGEWNHRQVRNLMAGETKTDFNAWYVLLGRQFSINPSFDATPYAMYEQISWSGTDNNPALGFSLVPISGFGTFIAGVNFGIFTNVHLKMEYSHATLSAKNFATGPTANTYADSDLAIDQYAAQFSVAF